MAEEDSRKDASKEEKPENQLEEATGYELKELAKAPARPPESKIDSPPKDGVGLTAALAMGLFFFAIIAGFAVSWLSAALLLIIGAPLLGVIYTLLKRTGKSRHSN